MKNHRSRKNCRKKSISLSATFPSAIIIMGSLKIFDELWQRPFYPTSDTPYHKPKILSSAKRSVRFFKYVTRPKQMCLRYTAAQCSECLEYFSLFNTTKHWKTWDDITNPPKISRKLLEVKNIFVCTDCIWFQEALDDLTETPPTSPLILLAG